MVGAMPTCPQEETLLTNLKLNIMKRLEIASSHREGRFRVFSLQNNETKNRVFIEIYECGNNKYALEWDDRYHASKSLIRGHEFEYIQDALVFAEKIYEMWQTAPVEMFFYGGYNIRTITPEIDFRLFSVECKLSPKEAEDVIAAI